MGISIILMFVDVDFCSFRFLYCETLMSKNYLEAKGVLFEHFRKIRE